MEHPAGPVGSGELFDLITSIHAQRDLTATMQAVTDAVVRAVGFRLAWVSVVGPDGEFTTVAVSGSEQTTPAMLGARRPARTYQDEFSVAEHWGSLRFVPHEPAPSDPTLSPVPDVAVRSDRKAWHRRDVLFAPLRSTNGDLIGVLSVDIPEDGLRPADAQRGLLQVLAVQAATALDNTLLTDRLRSSEQVFRLAFDGTSAGMALIAVTDGQLGRFTRVNPAFCRIVGYTAEHMLELTPQDLTHPEDRGTDTHRILDLIAGKSDRYSREQRYLHHNGSTVWVSVSATLARRDDGSPLCLLTHIQDISVRRSQLEQLHHHASHDPLTNLPHRTLILARLQASIDTARQTGRPGAVLILDLDNLTLVNDLHGHPVGDQVLVMVANRLRSSVREADLVGRLGGDEFLVIADDVDAQGRDLLATRIQAAIAAPITNKGVAVAVAVSVGVAAIGTDGDGGEATQIIQEAHQSMYRSKVHRRQVTHLP